MAKEMDMGVDANGEVYLEPVIPKSMKRCLHDTLRLNAATFIEMVEGILRDAHGGDRTAQALILKYGVGAPAPAPMGELAGDATFVINAGMYYADRPNPPCLESDAHTNGNGTNGHRRQT